MKRLVLIVLFQLQLTGCVTKQDIEDAKAKDVKPSISLKNLHPCIADSICQNQYNMLIQKAYDLVQNNPNKTTESLYEAVNKLNSANEKANDCGECLERQLTKWTNINKLSILGYKSSENLYKEYKDNDHKLRMRAYKSLIDVSNVPLQ